MDEYTSKCGRFMAVALILEIESASSFLGRPITPDHHKKLMGLSVDQLMREGHLAREAVMLRQMIETGEYARSQMGQQRDGKDPAGGLLN